MRLKTENISLNLAEHAFLKGLHPWYLEQLERYARFVSYSEGEIIFRENEEADNFYLLAKGNVVLELLSPRFGEVIVQNLSGGDIFGWSWMIHPYRWRFTARAVDDAIVIALNGRYLRSKCEEDHDLGYELMKRLSSTVISRLHDTRLQLIEGMRMAREEND